MIGTTGGTALMLRTEFDRLVDADDPVDGSVFPVEERSVQGEWISAALKRGCAVSLSHLTITEVVGILGDGINRPFSARDCVFADFTALHADFKSLVILVNCNLHSINFVGSSFRSVVLSDCRISESAQLSYVDVQKMADLSSLKCSGDLIARNARFGSLRLIGVDIAGDVTLNDSMIGAIFDLSKSTLKQSLFAQSISAAELRITDCQIDGDAWLDQTSLLGNFEGNNAAIRGRLSATRFTSSFAHLSSMQIGGSCCFDVAKLGHIVMANSVINGESRFTQVSCDSLDLSGSRFESDASFHNIRIAGDCFLTRSQWAQEVRLCHAYIGGAVRWLGNEEHAGDDKGSFARAASFIATTVVGPMQMFAVRLDEVADFSNFTSETTLRLFSCHFGLDAVFTALKTPECHIGACEIAGTLSLDQTNISRSLVVVDTTVGRSANISLATVGANLNIQRASIGDDLDLKLLTVNGTASILENTVSGVFDAARAQFDTLVLAQPYAHPQPKSDVSTDNADSTVTILPNVFKGGLYLEGARYYSIVAERSAMRRLFLQSPFVTRQPYVQLESALRRLGDNRWADEVYFQGRKRAARADRRPIVRVFEELLGLIAGFGVRPQYIIIWLLGGLILLTVFFLMLPGATLCSPNTDSKLPVPCATTRARVPSVLDAVGLSISILLPAAKQSVNGWAPTSAPVVFGVPFYYVTAAFRGFGYVLITGLLLSVTGLLRYVGRRD